MITRKVSGYSGRGMRLRSAMTPVMAMNRRPVAVMGRFRSWAWAIVLRLLAFPICFDLGGFVSMGEGSVRETKVGNDS
jgi:hypothetical protein